MITLMSIKKHNCLHFCNNTCGSVVLITELCQMHAVVLGVTKWCFYSYRVKVKVRHAGRTLQNEICLRQVKYCSRNMKYRRCRCEIFAFNGKGKGSATHYNALCRLCRHLPREKSIQIAESKPGSYPYYLLLTTCYFFGGQSINLFGLLGAQFCILHSAFCIH